MLDREALQSVLAEQYPLVDLDTAQRERLLERARQQALEVGEHLFQQGDVADRFYVVLSGCLKLYRLSAEGSERIMGLAEPEQSFAEGILFMESPRYPVNAQALEPSVVIGLERDTFLNILAESFPTCRAVLARMTQRIQNLLNEIEALSQQNARERLINYLLGLVPDKMDGAVSVQLPVRKSEVAARLSIQPETLSRLFRLLSEEGVIHTCRGRIEIPEISRLRTSTN